MYIMIHWLGELSHVVKWGSAVESALKGAPITANRQILACFEIFVIDGPLKSPENDQGECIYLDNLFW